MKALGFSRFDSSRMDERELRIMAVLEKTPGLSQKQLSQATGLNKSFISVIVRGLVCNGMLQRSRDVKDARNYRIHLTEEGRAAAIKPLHEECN